MRGLVTRSESHLSGAARSRRGFSLIDLLVSISVMVILMAILMPALGMAHESARRVRCASNIRQMGIALEVYVHDNSDYLPPAIYNQPPVQTSGRPTSGDVAPPDQVDDSGSDTMFLRYGSPDSYSSGPIWNGLGILVGEQYLNHPGVFYCPSHHGEHPYSTYAGEWGTGDGQIAGNYQYRIPAGIRHFSSLDRRTTIVADGMRTRSDYNHIKGNNCLRGDLSVTWYIDADGRVYNSLPETVHSPPSVTDRNNTWETIDNDL